MVQLPQISHVLQDILLSRFLSVPDIVQMGTAETQEEREDMGEGQVLAPERKQEMDVLFRQGRAIRTDGCEDKTPREGNQYEESLHRHGILSQQTE